MKRFGQIVAMLLLASTLFYSTKSNALTCPESLKRLYRFGEKITVGEKITPTSLKQARAAVESEIASSGKSAGALLVQVHLSDSVARHLALLERVDPNKLGGSASALGFHSKRLRLALGINLFKPWHITPKAFRVERIRQLAGGLKYKQVSFFKPRSWGTFILRTVWFPRFANDLIFRNAFLATIQSHLANDLKAANNPYKIEPVLGSGTIGNEIIRSSRSLKSKKLMIQKKRSQRFWS